MAEEVQRVVTVSGRGEVAVAPDLGRIRAGVRSEHRTTEGAMSIANRAITAIIDALQRAGIAEDDITLGRFSVDPVSDYVDGRRIHRGYQVAHMLTITVREIDRTGEVLSIAVDAGANDVGGVSFRVENPAPHTDRARERAFQNARHKAEELARLAGVQLGAVISMRETTYEPVEVEHYEMRAKSALMAMDAPAPVPVNPEDTEFSVGVEVAWALE